MTNLKHAPPEAILVALDVSKLRGCEVVLRKFRLGDRS